MEQKDQPNEVKGQDTAGGWREHLTRGRRERAGERGARTSGKMKGGYLREQARRGQGGTAAGAGGGGAATQCESEVQVPLSEGADSSRKIFFLKKWCLGAAGYDGGQIRVSFWRSKRGHFEFPSRRGSIDTLYSNFGSRAYHSAQKFVRSAT